MPAVQYYTVKFFDKSLNDATMAGGQSAKRAQKVRAILGSLNQQDPFVGVPMTSNGETRLDKCIKYNLGDGWRLVTIQDRGTCGFIFVGDHDAVEGFLDRHRGMRIGHRDGVAVRVPGGLGVDLTEVGRGPSGPNTRLLEGLGVDEDYVLTGVPPKAFRKIDDLVDRSDAGAIHAAAAEIPDEKRRVFVLAVLQLLAAGDMAGAAARIAFERGEIRAFDELEEGERIEIPDGDDIRKIVVGSLEYERYMAGLERTSSWQDWFLYLHPEQERVVNADFPGAAQLSGVSGSGKTCVLVRRAVRLAGARDARILMVTLNRSLAGLLTKLVDAICFDEAIRARITVKSFFGVARDLLIEIDPRSGITAVDRTWKLGEHVDEVFREFYRCWLNNGDAAVLRPLHGQLTSRGICAETYLREEFDWIRSAFPATGRAKYLSADRTGRRVPIVEDRRHDVLTGLLAWEAKMQQVGVVDYLGLMRLLDEPGVALSSRYSHVLVDEAQDFGTTELAVLRQLVPAGVNDVFLCGDVAQTVLPKHRSLTQAGLAGTKRERIVRNYRNSREILRAAYDLLVNNLDEDLFAGDGLELLDPKFANFSGAVPMALSAGSLAEEIAYARTYAASRLSGGVTSLCIAFAGYSARDVAAFADKCGETSLHGLYDPRETPLVLSDLEQTKGYEFETLIIVNCCDGVLPAADAPPEEAFRQACKLYVAMTRARKELVLSYHRAASPWLRAVAGSIGVDEWSENETLNAKMAMGKPELLPQVENAEDDSAILLLTGQAFLYTASACGLSFEAQGKLVELVDGKGLVGANNKRLRWRTIGQLATDLRASRLHDSLLGPAVSSELRVRLTPLLPLGESVREREPSVR